MRADHAYGKTRIMKPKQAARLIDLTGAPSGQNFLLSELMTMKLAQADQIETDHELLALCLQKLNASPAARALLSDAARMGWAFALEEAVYDYTLDSPSKIITLDRNALDADSIASSSYFMNALLLAMIKSLRDVWQDKRNSGYENLFSPESILLLERVRTADIAVMAILVCWELRSEGYGEIWRHVIGSDDGDLAMVFSGHLEREPHSTFTNDALAITFRQWFRHEDRVASCDHETLDMMDTIMAEPRMRQAFGEKSPTHIAVELFSCLPDRTAYLLGSGQNILTDPLYSGLNDPVNQTHFFQILHDRQAIFVNGVAFRDAGLAVKIFPPEKESMEEGV